MTEQARSSGPACALGIAQRSTLAPPARRAAAAVAVGACTCLLAIVALAHPARMRALHHSLVGRHTGPDDAAAQQQQQQDSRLPAEELPACDLAALDGLLGPGVDLVWATPAHPNGTVAGLPRLEVQRRCRLRRFTAEQARACLAGRPLVFIGDSLTRYQYVTLLYFLEFGEWPAQLLGTAEHPSPVIQKEWASWNDYFKGSRRVTGRGCRAGAIHFIMRATPKHVT